MSEPEDLKMRIEEFSPREFLRARHPERFSDSIVENIPSLDRSILEYHLDTLTSRKQEYQFERFAQRLAEREICPNLLPQTGPTGGGDSKVDAETYPVADDLSLGWCIGIGREAASERWAFAFSAKKRWRGKVRSDVAKLVAAGRGYQKAFFVSNQFIRDKTRAEMEDELRAEYDIDVRILDRTWILDRVFRNGHEDLAIEELGLSTEIRKAVRRGPSDRERGRELDSLEEKIKQALLEHRLGPQLADDCIEAAILSRQLELPRYEVEGRLSRAERVSTRHGTPHQCLQCAYQTAWTFFWWYEDYEQFVEAYGTVEERALGSRNSYHLELLTTLWFLLPTALREGTLDWAENVFEVHTHTLIGELSRLAEEEARPSSALHAQTLLLQVRLLLATESGEPVEPILGELQDVLRQGEGLAGYPLESQADMLIELGRFLGDMPGYDELFETIVDVTSTRKEEVSAARMLLGRAQQKLDSGRPYDTIRLLGRTLRSLYKHESRDDCVRALYLCGCAYERVGLLWAARGSLLAAASLATDEFWRYGDVLPVQAASYGRLKWVELQLGRLAHTLAWYEVETQAKSVLADQGYDEDDLYKGYPEFDLILGILLLRTDLWELKWLSNLPDVLEGLGLFCAAAALVYALGHEEHLRDEGFTELWEDEDLRSVFLRLCDQPAAEELPQRPLLCNTREITLRSTLLGCQVVVKTENESPCVEVAESVLAALESLLSTGVVHQMMMHEPRLTIAVRKSDFVKSPFEFELQEQGGRPHVDISCHPFDPHQMSLEAQAEVRGRLLELLVTIVSRIVVIKDPEQLIEKLFSNELAIDRSVGFTGSFVTVGNVLGQDPKTTISSWSDEDACTYPLRRSKPWYAEDDQPATRLSPGSGSAVLAGDGVGPSADIVDESCVKHTEIQAVSLIRNPLWDSADWSGTAFGFSPDRSFPPVLAPTFSGSEEAAKQIFAHWRKEIGRRDVEERIFVALVRGIDKANPYSYRVMIGTNPEILPSERRVKIVTHAYRISTMEPSSDTNLERFLDSYEHFREYCLAPAVPIGDVTEPRLLWEYSIFKRQLRVREAWEVGRHDAESACILIGDEPLIPPGKKNPPVLEVLRWKQDRMSGSRESSSESA